MTSLITRILPPVVDNTYRGNRIGLVMFGLITAVTLWRSQHHMLAADGGAQSIATIPLDTYPEGAAATVIAIFAQWGLSQFLLGLLYLLVLIRYRSLIPLFCIFFILEYGGRLTVSLFKSIETAGTAPGSVGNAPAILVGVVMLVLTLRERRAK